MRCDYREWQEIHPWRLYLALLANLAAKGHRVSSHGDLNARPGLEVPDFDQHPPRVVEDLELKPRGKELVDVCTHNRYIIINGCSSIAGEHGGFTFYHHADTSIPGYCSTIDFTIVSLSLLDRVERMDVLNKTRHSGHCATISALHIPAQPMNGRRRRDLEPRMETALDLRLKDLLASSMNKDEWNVHRYSAYYDITTTTIGKRCMPMARALSLENRGRRPARAFTLARGASGLFAILVVVADTPLQYALNIRTDSLYAIKTIAHLGPKLAQMGWRGPNGDILAAIQHHIRRRLCRVVFHWVKGHSGNEGNENADTLAKEAAAAIPTPFAPSIYPELNEPVTVEDIEAVKALWDEKTGSAAGIDHATYPQVIPIDNAELSTFLNVCMDECDAPGACSQAILSSVPKPGKDPRTTDGYRGIALQSTVYKAWSGAYTKRLSGVVEKAGILPPNQNGFRAGFRTYNNVFILRTMIDKSEAAGEPLYVTFVDISSMFPSINHNALWLVMDQLSLTGRYFDFTRKMYQDMSIVVAHGGRVSEEWKSLCGVLMGDPPSPMLWNLFLLTFKPEADPDDVSLAGMFLRYLAHADDLALMSRTVAGLQRLLRLLECRCRLVFLIANGLKSAGMVFGRIPADSPQLQTLSFGGSDVPWVMDHKFVGITFQSGMRDIHLVHWEVSD
uniref:RNase H type-1 domain-containing protein n=1 Tax=Mycena chlorophos TaxID=658473 RepID=A0ABQ0LQG9_MYCCL|nr:predicted protein [Mycena chlorophos]